MAEDKKPIRLIGTWDDKGTLLFSKGHKNFRYKTPCHWCHQKKPMVHRYARAKKGEAVQFSEAVFCSVECYRKRIESPNSPGGLQGEASGC